MGFNDLISNIIDVAMSVARDLTHEGFVVRQNELSYNPVTDVRITEEILHRFVSVQDSNKEDGRDNTETPVYDLVLWVKFDEADFMPLLNDTVKIDDEIFYVKNVNPIKPGNQALLYSLGLMK